MPVIEAHLLEGYGPDDKQRLSEALTDAVRFILPAPDEAITVLLHEHPADCYAGGGRARVPAPPRPDPKKLVLDFLAAMEERDLDAARALLGPGFKMVFPGPKNMTGLGELVDWAAGRYRFVRKTHDGIEAFQDGQRTVVYVRGLLSGEWPDGEAFEGIRYIDRFEIADGLIVRQDVWNDLAEARPT